MIYKTALSVANALYDHYGNDKTYYFSEVKQGLKKPCFFIKVVSAKYQRQIANFFLVTQKIKVIYIPKSEDEYEEENMQVGYTAMRLVEQIAMEGGGYVRGFNINAYDNDGEFVINVDYKFRAYCKSETDMMSTLTVSGKPKIGGR